MTCCCTHETPMSLFSHNKCDKKQLSTGSWTYFLLYILLIWGCIRTQRTPAPCRQTDRPRCNAPSVALSCVRVRVCGCSGRCTCTCWWVSASYCTTRSSSLHDAVTDTPTTSCQLSLYLLHTDLLTYYYLRCIDAVGWAAGRASDL